MTIFSRNVKRGAPILFFVKIDVTSSCDELFRDGRMSILGSDVQRRSPILKHRVGRFLCLKINVTASFYQVLDDQSMTILCHNEERRDPALLLRENVDVTASLNQLNRHSELESAESWWTHAHFALR